MKKLTKWDIAVKIDRIHKETGSRFAGCPIRFNCNSYPRAELVAYYNHLAAENGLATIV